MLSPGGQPSQFSRLAASATRPQTTQALGSSASTLSSGGYDRPGYLEHTVEALKKDQEATRSALAWVRREIEGLEAVRTRVDGCEAACQDMQRAAIETRKNLDSAEARHEELWSDTQGTARQLMAFQQELKSIATELSGTQTPRVGFSDDHLRQLDQAVQRADQVHDLARRMEEQVRHTESLSKAVEKTADSMGSFLDRETVLCRRVDHMDRVLGEIRQDHLAETVALKERVEATAGDLDQHSMRAEAFREELERKSVGMSALTSRLDATEHKVNGELTVRSAAVSLEVLQARLNAVEDEIKQSTRESITSSSTLQARLHSLEDDFKQIASQPTRPSQTSTNTTSTDEFQSLAARVSSFEGNLQLVEKVLATLEAVNIEAVNKSSDSEGTLAALQLRLQTLEQDAQAAQAMQTRVSTLENDVAAAKFIANLHESPSGAAAPVASPRDGLLPRADSGQMSPRVMSLLEKLPVELSVVVARVDRAERRIDAAESAIASQDVHQRLATASRPSPAESDILAPKTYASVEDVAELRNALAETCSGLARLAHDLAHVREEHTYAISNVGDLTEFVAKAAASSIARAEQRFEKQLAGKAAEIERTSAAQREEMAATASAILSEAANAAKQVSATASASHDTPRKGSGEMTGSVSDVFTLGASLGEKAAQLRIDLMSKLDSQAAELRGDMYQRIGVTESKIELIEKTVYKRLDSIVTQSPGNQRRSLRNEIGYGLQSANEIDEDKCESASQVSNKSIRSSSSGLPLQQVSASFGELERSKSPTFLQSGVVYPQHTSFIYNTLSSPGNSGPLLGSQIAGSPQLQPHRGSAPSNLKSRLENLVQTVHQALGGDGTPLSSVSQRPGLARPLTQVNTTGSPPLQMLSSRGRVLAGSPERRQSNEFQPRTRPGTGSDVIMSRDGIISNEELPDTAYGMANTIPFGYVDTANMQRPLRSMSPNASPEQIEVMNTPIDRLSISMKPGITSRNPGITSQSTRTPLNVSAPNSRSGGVAQGCSSAANSRGSSISGMQPPTPQISRPAVSGPSVSGGKGGNYGRSNMSQVSPAGAMAARRQQFGLSGPGYR